MQKILSMFGYVTFQKTLARNIYDSNQLLVAIPPHDSTDFASPTFMLRISAPRTLDDHDFLELVC